jgi:hypothetical protein
MSQTAQKDPARLNFPKYGCAAHMLVNLKKAPYNPINKPKPARNIASPPAPRASHEA